MSTYVMMMLVMVLAMRDDHGDFAAEDEVPVGPPVSLTINCQNWKTRQ